MKVLIVDEMHESIVHMPEELGLEVDYFPNIALSEVLEKPELNTKEYLEARVMELHALPANELSRLGKLAKTKNQSEDEKEVEKIREDYKVS